MCRVVCSLGSAVALAALAGCGPTEPPVYPVEGTVMFDGKPLAEFTVEFSSQAEATKGMNARGDVQADGTFKLTTTVNGKAKEGAVAGPHKVVVVTPSIAVTGPRPVPQVPLQYSDYNKSGLTFEVKPGEANKYVIVLDK